MVRLRLRMGGRILGRFGPRARLGVRARETDFGLLVAGLVALVTAVRATEGVKKAKAMASA